MLHEDWLQFVRQSALGPSSVEPQVEVAEESDAVVRVSQHVLCLLPQGLVPHSRDEAGTWQQPSAAAVPALQVPDGFSLPEQVLLPAVHGEEPRVEQQLSVGLHADPAQSDFFTSKLVQPLPAQEPSRQSLAAAALTPAHVTAIFSLSQQLVPVAHGEELAVEQQAPLDPHDSEGLVFRAERELPQVVPPPPSHKPPLQLVPAQVTPSLLTGIKAHASGLASPAQHPHAPPWNASSYDILIACTPSLKMNTDSKQASTASSHQKLQNATVQ